MISTKKTSMFDVSLNGTSKNTFARKILDVLQQGISSLNKKNNVIRVLLSFVQCSASMGGFGVGPRGQPPPFFCDVSFLF